MAEPIFGSLTEHSWTFEEDKLEHIHIVYQRRIIPVYLQLP
jgi:hypothetical protein